MFLTWSLGEKWWYSLMQKGNKVCRNRKKMSSE